MKINKIKKIKKFKCKTKYNKRIKYIKMDYYIDNDEILNTDLNKFDYCNIHSSKIISDFNSCILLIGLSAFLFTLF